MKRFSAFLMAILMLGLSTQNAVLIVSFKLNQKYISKTFCVNRNTTAEKVCNGTCYLEDQLIENNDGNENDPIPALNEMKETVLFFNVLATLITDSRDIQEAMIFHADCVGMSGHLSGVFHPPKV